MAEINVRLLTRELQAAGLPVVGVDATGKIEYSRELTEEEDAAADAVIKAHDPDPEPAVTDAERVAALWAKVVEGKTDEESGITDIVSKK